MPARHGNSVMLMAPPPGGFFSREVVDHNAGSDGMSNEIFEPGCSTQTTRKNLANGETEVTRSLVCNTVIVKSSKGRTRLNPSAESRLGKKDANLVKDFMLGTLKD